ncbi:hypothetical protein [Streptomyces abyssalis]|uniref:hypothetical protein n=1 Tax=Streptomyces abyssalis TaxID=933944 RepID=UPI0014960B32|nr:hypothetical protein [Streptomyces abyssalis]
MQRTLCGVRPRSRRRQAGGQHIGGVRLGSPYGPGAARLSAACDSAVCEGAAVD